MTAPFIPRALLAAATPSADYDSIVGDLQEEYGQRIVRDGRSRADLWYWSQALRSLPALLSYSRTYPSFGRRASTAATVLGVLLAMLAGKDLLDRLIEALHPGGVLPAWLYFLLDWMVAAACGALLAQILRQHPVRLALFASIGLVIAFATPIVLALSPDISFPAWLLLLGTIPAMSIGAATIHALHKR
jgi:hypothetical protein